MIRKKYIFAVLIFSLFSFTNCTEGKIAKNTADTITDTRARVIVSTDIGGTDPDDFQSMVHLLVYADMLDIEGLISSPYGFGRAEHILQVIRYYEQDYPNLKTYSDKYPTADELRAVTEQGAYDFAGQEGISQATEGSNWIIECARRVPIHSKPSSRSLDRRIRCNLSRLVCRRQSVG